MQALVLISLNFVEAKKFFIYFTNFFIINFLSEDSKTQWADDTTRSAEDSLQFRAEQPSGISPSTNSHPYRDS